MSGPAGAAGGTPAEHFPGFRTLVSTLCLTPLMTYLVLPRVTAALRWWLQGEAAPWRRRRTG